MKNRITEIFNISLPIVSGGMVWCSGAKLAAAVTNAGGLGLIGAGSMHPDVLREHIIKCRNLVGGKTFGVNIPLFYPELEAVITIIIEENVPVVFTSGGNPGLYTARLKEAGIVVGHVVASGKFAAKAEAAGVDVIVAEGFEAGGHNGKAELTTMALIPIVRASVKTTPILAAGGIATGEQWLAAMALGAEGVQIGSLFAVTEESSAHPDFKAMCVGLGEEATMLALKKITPVRLIKNEFYKRVAEAEDRGATVDELREILGKGRAKRGIFEGDLAEGELEIGQAVASIEAVKPAARVISELVERYNAALGQIVKM